MKQSQFAAQRQVQKQSLKLAPKLRQSLELLQLSGLKLEAEIQKKLEDNIMLETTTDPVEKTTSDIQTTESTLAEPINFARSTGKGAQGNEQQDVYEYTEAQTGNLATHLTEQLDLESTDLLTRLCATSIIYSLDENGFLTLALEEVAAVAKDGQQQPDSADMLRGLHLVQSLDPAGVAARNPQECLLLQLKRLPEDSPFLQEAKMLVDKYLHDLARLDLKKLRKKTGLDTTQIQEALCLIRALNPHPGNSFNQEQTEYIIPDVRIRKLSDEKWHIELAANPATHLRINSYYQSLTKEDNQAARTMLKSHLQEAKWFLQALEKRTDTVYRIACSILDKQRAFFERGLEAMRPLSIGNIAEELELHLSTISRAVNNKYMDTPHGIFPFRAFFSSELTSSNGESSSATAVQVLIKKIISAENPQKPLSDNRIADMLKQKGLNIARRTVSKYRESLSIPSSSDRKKLY